MFNKVIASLTATLLVGAGVFATTSVASADEVTPPVEETAVVAEAEVAPAEEVAPVVETVVEPVVVEPAPAPAAAEESAPVVTEEVAAPAAAPAEVLANAPPAEVAAPAAAARTTHPGQDGGSDAPTPYSVTAEGITLPAGYTFQDNGHVNIKTSDGPKGIHFESRNGQPSGQWIGKSFLPWSAFGLTAPFSVTWVQISDFNQHFGEGGQPPVVVGETKPEQVEVFVWWLLDKASTQAKPFVKPQTLISTGYEPKPTLLCGQIAQGDRYKGTQAQIDAVIADGILVNAAEDASIYVSHEFLSGPKCTTTTVQVPDLPVTPPTCTEPGSLPWTSNPPAQNPNGYEFPGQGFRVYLDKAYTGPGTYVATIQKIGAGVDPAFWGGTKVEGNLKQTLVVKAAIGNQSTNGTGPCFVPPTENKVRVDTATWPVCVKDDSGVNTGFANIKAYVKNQYAKNSNITIQGYVSIKDHPEFGTLPFDLAPDKAFTGWFENWPAANGDGTIVATVTSVNGIAHTLTASEEFYNVGTCTAPVDVVNPTVSKEETCGSVTYTFTNPKDERWYATTKTASFVVFVDGKFREALAVEAGATDTRTYEFGEDSGDHSVEVFQAGLSEWASLDKTVVKTDCIPPLPEPQETPVVTYAADCDGVVTKTTVVYSTPWIWSGEEYVLDEDNTTSGEPTTEVIDASEVPEGAEVFVPVDCETEEPPVTPEDPETPTTPPSTPGTPSTTPEPTPSATPVADPTTPAATQASLAVTGSTIAWTIAGIVLLLALGTGFVLIRRAGLARR